ncbi:hypothetical protein GCM10017691_00610 [Pseudonocardia petroleophila]|uniref:DUF397 domain-containing protein n=1 Tax=Pseudonocardia petroleophila TaxID=37331 RepID=A0A7G7MLH3_9PSEU|nr:DUF397 domain-containing protein [Pseudonocardia petroleophila]QNG53634.1 DUF397 domain-containing protein [Pseudonocardia petroleophila]
MDDGKPIYRSSSFCAVGACLEVGRSNAGEVLIRDSKRPNLTLTLTATEWESFVEGVKAGEFDTL